MKGHLNGCFVEYLALRRGVTQVVSGASVPAGMDEHGTGKE